MTAQTGKKRKNYSNLIQIKHIIKPKPSQQKHTKTGRGKYVKATGIIMLITNTTEVNKLYQHHRSEQTTIFRI